jgi:hypothetical protein
MNRQPLSTQVGPSSSELAVLVAFKVGLKPALAHLRRHTSSPASS